MFSFHMLTIKNKGLTIGNSTNFWRKSWESYRLKSPKSAMGKKKKHMMSKDSDAYSA